MKTFISCGGWAAVLAWLTGASAVRGEDLTTLSGKTYRQVVVVRVEPDGITWKYETGMCKVDFMDSPESVRRAYHYDPAKAAAYHDAQEQTRVQFTERNQQLLREDETRQRAKYQYKLSLDGIAAGGFQFRRRESPALTLAERSVGEQIDTFKAKRRAERADVGTIADPIVWGSIPRPVMMLLSLFASGGGANQDPRVVGVNSFPEANYSARSYYEGVDYSDRLLGKKR